MLALTRKTEYALIALAYLAQHRGDVANARAIARRYRVPASLLMNVLKRLAHEGLLQSVRGSKGGYILAQDPHDVSLHDLIVAVEGPMHFVQCAGAPSDDECELTDVCPVSRPVRRIHDRLEQFLRDVTLAEIAADACCCSRDQPAARVPVAIARMESKV